MKLSNVPVDESIERIKKFQKEAEQVSKHRGPVPTSYLRRIHRTRVEEKQREAEQKARRKCPSSSQRTVFENDGTPFIMAASFEHSSRGEEPSFQTVESSTDSDMFDGGECGGGGAGGDF